MVDHRIGWKCPYCRKVYDKEFMARDCANECVEVESPEQVDTIHCSICNKRHITIERAEKCELKHEESNDPLYQQYLVKKNFDALKKAASVPGQLKLVATGKSGVRA